MGERDRIPVVDDKTAAHFVPGAVEEGKEAAGEHCGRLLRGAD